MGKGRVRVKGSKGKRWKKGQSSGSNPSEISHRQAARGKFSNHLSRGKSSTPLTAEALANLQQDQYSDKDADIESMKDEITGSAASSSALSLIETAHPVFGAVRKLWHSPTESHREICAVLAAVSEVVKSYDGKDTGTEYFGALMSVLESSNDEKSTAAICYLLCLLMPSVPRDVLQMKYSTTCKILTDQLTLHETSTSTALLKSLVKTLCYLLEAQPMSTWNDSHCQRIFHTILNYTLHPKPKVRKATQASVFAMLREGTPSGDIHSAATIFTTHCTHVFTKRGSEETGILHILGMLRECLANLQTQHIKSLCEVILKTMLLGSTLLRTSCLQCIHGMMTSLAGPQGLTTPLTARIIAALYDHQPSLSDWQLLQAWLTVMFASHIRLASLDQELSITHLVRLFSVCISSLTSHNSKLLLTSYSNMQTLLTDVLKPYIDSLDVSNKSSLLTVQNIYKILMKGLEYRYQHSWSYVLKILTIFYRISGEKCHTAIASGLSSLCSFHSLSDFKYTTELEKAIGVAIATMGPKVVLQYVSLDLDPHSLSLSWLLPILRDYISHTDLSYFTNTILPMASQMKSRADRCMEEAGKSKDAMLYTTLYHQVWSLLVGFCRQPRDIPVSFPCLARILGTALNTQPELRVTIATSLKQLVDSSRDKEDDKLVLSRFSKNYLPIFFNLYTTEEEEERQVILECIQSYISISDKHLITSFTTMAIEKIVDHSLIKTKRHRLLDLLAVMVVHVPHSTLESIVDTISPLLDSTDSTLQKKGYKVLEQLMSCDAHTHKKFVQEHLQKLTSSLTDSLSTATTASKKPRLRCLLSLLDHISQDTADFISTIIPEVILCTKETNEKCRTLAYQLLVRIGYTAQRCYGLNPEDSITRYMNIVLAGLAGSAHMMSASVISLSRLVYEFHDVLSNDVMKKLVMTMCKLLSSHTREVVKATFGFIKIAIKVIPTDELSPHLEILIKGVLHWSGDPKSHFRLKARFILERLCRKFGYEMIFGLTPVKHQKLLVNIKKSMDKQKRLKKTSINNDSEDEDNRDVVSRSGRGSWIKETSDDDPLDFLDTSNIAHKISSIHPLHERSQTKVDSYPTSAEGKLIISDDDITDDITRTNTIETDSSKVKNTNRKRKNEEDGSDDGGKTGVGIYRKNTTKMEFNYGAEYKAKRARGDIKVKGQPDPYAYVPLLNEKLNRRKRVKLSGQFKGLMKKARNKPAIAAGIRQRRK